MIDPYQPKIRTMNLNKKLQLMNLNPHQNSTRTKNPLLYMNLSQTSIATFTETALIEAEQSKKITATLKFLIKAIITTLTRNSQTISKT